MVNVWCCEHTDSGEPCPDPAEYLILYGSAPDETTLMCKEHTRKTWEPYWQTVPLTDEQRQEWAVPWEDWIDKNRYVHWLEAKHGSPG